MNADRRRRVRTEHADPDGPTPSTTKEHGGRELVKRVGMVVEGEVKRARAEGQIRPDPELIADGWERRFVADARRAEETMELYEQLGFEVRAEPAQAEELGDDCDDCQLLLLLQFKTIYTRKRGP